MWGNHPAMEQPRPTSLPGPSTDDRVLRRIIAAAGLLLGALILVAAGVYAAAFLVLAPMMR